jgi:hypothetical protein
MKLRFHRVANVKNTHAIVPHENRQENTIKNINKYSKSFFIYFPSHNFDKINFP